jgi:hypothetical protein
LFPLSLSQLSLSLVAAAPPRPRFPRQLLARKLPLLKKLLATKLLKALQRKLRLLKRLLRHPKKLLSNLSVSSFHREAVTMTSSPFFFL